MLEHGGDEIWRRHFVGRAGRMFSVNARNYEQHETNQHGRERNAKCTQKRSLRYIEYHVLFMVIRVPKHRQKQLQV